MNTSKLAAVRHGITSSDQETVGVEKEGQGRDRMYKRKNMKFDTTSSERRTLKSMEVTV